MERSEFNRRKLPTGRMTRFFIYILIALMAAFALFCGIYALLGVPAEDLPLAPGFRYAVDERGIGMIGMRCGAMAGEVPVDALSRGDIKLPMYLFVLRTEAVLLTLTVLLVCLSRIMESIRVCRVCTDYAARQTAYAGLSLIAGGVICSLADGLSDYLIMKNYFSAVLSAAGTKAVFHASFPLAAVLGGVFLILLGALLDRVAENPTAENMPIMQENTADRQ